MLKCKLLSHYFSYSAMRDLFFNCCCPFFSHENGREVLKFLGLNVTQILTALWPHSNFRSKYNIYYRGASFWSTENVDDEGCLLSRGWKINGAWMSGFTVPSDKRHLHFAPPRTPQKMSRKRLETDDLNRFYILLDFVGCAVAKATSDYEW